MVISMLKIRRPLGRLIFNMGIAIPGKTVFLIETAPRYQAIIWTDSDQNVYHMDLLGPNKLITCISLPVFILVPCLAVSSHFRKLYSKQLTSFNAIMISGNGNTHLILNQLPLNFVR